MVFPESSPRVTVAPKGAFCSGMDLAIGGSYAVVQDWKRKRILVDSVADCDAASGRIVAGPTGGDAGTGTTPTGTCFVRSVRTRGLGDLILDIGITEKLSSQLASNVDIPRETKPAASRKTLSLSSTNRLRLAARVTRSILKLAVTYNTGLDFRVYIFLRRPAGRSYSMTMSTTSREIYEIARNDYTLLNDLASAWLEVHPFVAGHGDSQGRRSQGSIGRETSCSHETLFRAWPGFDPTLRRGDKEFRLSSPDARA